MGFGGPLEKPFCEVAVAGALDPGPDWEALVGSTFRAGDWTTRIVRGAGRFAGDIGTFPLPATPFKAALSSFAAFALGAVDALVGFGTEADADDGADTMAEPLLEAPEPFGGNDDFEAFLETGGEVRAGVAGLDRAVPATREVETKTILCFLEPALDTGVAFAADGEGWREEPA